MHTHKNKAHNSPYQQSHSCLKCSKVGQDISKPFLKPPWLAKSVDAIVDMTLPVTEHAMQVVPRSIPTGSGAQSRVLALHWVSEMGEVPRSFLGIHFQEI